MKLFSRMQDKVRQETGSGPRSQKGGEGIAGTPLDALATCCHLDNDCNQMDNARSSVKHLHRLQIAEHPAGQRRAALSVPETECRLAWYPVPEHGGFSPIRNRSASGIDEEGQVMVAEGGGGNHGLITAGADAVAMANGHPIRCRMLSVLFREHLSEGSEDSSLRPWGDAPQASDQPRSVHRTKLVKHDLT